MFYGYTTLATDFKPDTGLVKLLWRVLFFIPRKNRGNEIIYPYVKKWFLEIDDAGVPVREIALDEEDAPLFGSPGGWKAAGYWTDGVKTFRKEELTPGSAEEFEKLWVDTMRDPFEIPVNPEHEKRMQLLQKQLKEAPEVEVIGVISAKGSHGFCGELYFDFENWKAKDGAIENSKLSVQKDMGDEEFTPYLEKLRPYHIIRAKVRLCRENVLESPQAILLELLGSAQDADLAQVALMLQKPVTFDDAQFGIFTLDRRSDWWVAPVLWNGISARLDLDAEGVEEVAKSLAAARNLWSAQGDWHKKITDRTIEDLLETKNGGWLGEDEKEFTPAQFVGKLILETIHVRSSGSFEFWFKDGDLFWGHDIMVRGSLEDGAEDASLQG